MTVTVYHIEITGLVFDNLWLDSWNQEASPLPITHQNILKPMRSNFIVPAIDYSLSEDIHSCVLVVIYSCLFSIY